MCAKVGLHGLITVTRNVGYRRIALKKSAGRVQMAFRAERAPIMRSNFKDSFIGMSI